MPAYSLRQAGQLFIIFVASLLFYCYEFFLRLLTGAYQPQITQHFAIHHNLSFSFLISSYNFTYLLMQIPAGILLDRYGSKRVLMVATLVCGIGNILFVVDGYYVALLARLLVGFGSAFAFIGVLKVSREYMPGRYFSLFAAIAISLGTLAAAFSQQLSILLLEYGLSWRFVFVASGLVALPIAIFFYVSFTLIQSKVEVQVFPKLPIITQQVRQLLALKYLWLNAAWAGLIYIPTIILTAQYGIKYFHSLYDLNSYQSLEMVTFILLGWVVCSPLYSFWVSRWGQMNKVIVIAGFLLMVSLSVMSYFPHSIAHWLSNVCFLVGMFSAVQVLVWHWFHRICPQNISAVGMAITNMIITGVTEVGQLFSGAMLDWHAVQHTLGLSQPIQFVSVLFLLAVLASLLLLRKMRYHPLS